jgi:hypothetical protein
MTEGGRDTERHEGLTMTATVEFPSARAHEVVEAVGRLERLKDVRELTALFTSTR